jgi:uncharacterized membrane protein HdeD (DUF308 family)
MKEKIKNFLHGRMPFTIILIILGLCLILTPVGALHVICKVFFGLALIIAGLHHIYLHISDKMVSTILDPFSGVITLTIGIFLFSNPQIVVMLLPWMLGGFLLIDCVWLLKSVFMLKKKRLSQWEGILVVSVIFLILAIVLIVDPFKTIRTMLTFGGWVFLFKGVSDIILNVMIKNAQKEAEHMRQAYANVQNAGNYSVVPSYGNKKAQQAAGQSVPQTAPTVQQTEQLQAPAQEDVYVQDTAYTQETPYVQDVEISPELTFDDVRPDAQQ